MAVCLLLMMSLMHWAVPSLLNKKKSPEKYSLDSYSQMLSILSDRAKRTPGHGISFKDITGSICNLKADWGLWSPSDIAMNRLFLGGTCEDSPPAVKLTAWAATPLPLSLQGLCVPEFPSRSVSWVWRASGSPQLPVPVLQAAAGGGGDYSILLPNLAL